MQQFRSKYLRVCSQERCETTLCLFEHAQTLGLLDENLMAVQEDEWEILETGVEDDVSWESELLDEVLGEEKLEDLHDWGMGWCGWQSHLLASLYLSNGARAAHSRPGLQSMSKRRQPDKACVEMPCWQIPRRAENMIESARFSAR